MPSAGVQLSGPGHINLRAGNSANASGSALLTCTQDYQPWRAEHKENKEKKKSLVRILSTQSPCAMHCRYVTAVADVHFAQLGTSTDNGPWQYGVCIPPRHTANGCTKERLLPYEHRAARHPQILSQGAFVLEGWQTNGNFVKDYQGTRCKAMRLCSHKSRQSIAVVHARILRHHTGLGTALMLWLIRYSRRFNPWNK